MGLMKKLIDLSGINKSYRNGVRTAGLKTSIFKLKKVVFSHYGTILDLVNNYDEYYWHVDRPSSG